jgi:hypothetical protein
VPNLGGGFMAMSNAERQKRYRERFPEKTKKYHETFRNTHPTHQHKYGLLRKYGLSVDDYNVMVAKQKGQCAICGIHQSNLKKKLHVDHDHVSGEIRGLLCSRCNIVIGTFNDDTKILKSAIIYLTKKNMRTNSNGRVRDSASSLFKEQS